MYYFHEKRNALYCRAKSRMYWFYYDVCLCFKIRIETFVMSVNLFSTRHLGSNFPCSFLNTWTAPFFFNNRFKCQILMKILKIQWHMFDWTSRKTIFTFTIVIFLTIFVVAYRLKLNSLLYPPSYLPDFPPNTVDHLRREVYVFKKKKKNLFQKRGKTCVLVEKSRL